MFHIRYFAPHPQLRHLIRSYYIYDVSVPADTVIADRLITEFANLRVLIGGNWHVTTHGDGALVPAPVNLAGPNSHPLFFRSTGSFKIFGMSVQPLGWTALVDGPAAYAADRVVPAADLLGADAVDKIADIVVGASSDDAMIDAIESALMCRLRQRAPRLSPIVRAVQDLISTQPIGRVDDLGVRVETSARQLERLTKDAFGFSPKTTLRRARIRRTIDAMKGCIPVDWQLQAEQDFADQSHLIHEFRRFTGLTPGVYLSRPTPLMDAGHAMHAALLRKMRQPQDPDVRLKVQVLLDNLGTPALPQAEAA